MRFRKLRIAWSVLCGVACVLLIVCWCTSYFWSLNSSNDVDEPKVLFTSQELTITNSQGTLLIWSHPGIIWPHTYGWHGGCGWWSSRMFTATERGSKVVPEFKWQSSATGYEIQAPDWFFLPVLGIIAALPWVVPHLRFSLHTLLIATKLVAVVLVVAV